MYNYLSIWLIQRDIHNLHSPLPPSLEQKYSGAVTMFGDLRSRQSLSVERDWEQDVRSAASHAPLQTSHAHPRDRVLVWMRQAYSQNQLLQISNAEPRIIPRSALDL